MPLFLNLHCHPSKIYSQQMHDLLHFLNSNIFGSGENFDLKVFALNLEFVSSFNPLRDNPTKCSTHSNNSPATADKLFECV